jgi:TatD DNase family protein
MNNPIRFIDTHMHANAEAFLEDREEVLARARADGVARFIEIGYNLQSSYKAVELAERFDDVYAVVGMQPNHAHDLEEGWDKQIHTLLQHPKVVALGEIGLDYHWDYATPEQQDRVFRMQLEIARDLNMPIVIHTREAQADTLKVLREAGHGVTGVMHSFSGDWVFANDCMALGFYLSFSGPLTFPKTHDLHDVARRGPLDRFLTETDSPYLSPHPLRGRRNEPARVRFVTEQLARLREQSLEEVAAAVWENARRIFSKLP